MRLLLFTCLILGFLSVITSCSYKQDQVLFEQRNSINDSALQKNLANISEYRIKPQDILQIRNLQNSKNIIDLNPGTSPSLQSAASTQTETYQVEDDGTVALTGLGRIQVAGLTRLQAMELIEHLYHENFLKSPLIELKIINLKVTLLGEVKAQGNYSLTKDRTSLVEVIGEAGGLTDRANERNIKIYRGDQLNPTIIQIDLSDQKSISDPATRLQSGDIIYIAQNKRAIRSDKIQNFSTIMQPALIIFSTALLIYTLVRH
jgi:polysaccharide export outer membrane protein